MFLSNLSILPITYYLAVLLLLVLVWEACIRLELGMRVILLMIYGTIAFWYMVEILAYPADYSFFPSRVLNIAFAQVAFFLIASRILLPFLAQRLLPTKKPLLHNRGVSSGAMLAVLIPLWVALTAFGTIRMNGDLLAALFPIWSRGSAMGSMWGREGIGGSFDFIVSAAGYLHLFVCSMFGLLLLYPQTPLRKVILLGLVLITWPYFFFVGARNQLLAVIAPFVLGYILRSRQQRFVKLALVVTALVCTEFAMRAIVEYRSVGFEQFFSDDIDQSSPQEDTRHLGMNMGQELLFIDMFQEAGVLEYSWGKDYLAEAANIIPRALWPDKPAIGYEYAILRGFGNDQTLGVWATVSRGLIGQGVINFGWVFGPLVAATLISLYGAILYRWWCRRETLSRFSLFVLGVGMTFNLGRDFTLLVLWPVVFGYVLVRLIEWWRDRFHLEGSEVEDFTLASRA